MKYFKENNQTEKTLIIVTGFSCNNNCLMCSIKPEGENTHDSSFDDIVNRLKGGIVDNFDRVEFTGGEPTIRKDFFKIIDSARRMGYRHVSMSTNGRMLSNNGFIEKVSEIGIDRITISLHASRAQIHNSLTRTPNSFEQIILGIKKLKSLPSLELYVSTVVTKLNIDNIVELGEFLLELGIKEWNLLDLIPDGRANKYYKNLAFSYNELYNVLLKLSDTAQNFAEMSFFDFPYCVIPRELLNKKNCRVINAASRINTAKQSGYNPKRIKKNDDGEFKDIFKSKIDICKKCEKKGLCAGVWDRYLDFFQENGLISLYKLNMTK
ncbi:radical SAM protein [bacterium]|nr:radical SAM protein [bacterium]